jgi:hypothetical protein
MHDPEIMVGAQLNPGGADGRRPSLLDHVLADVGAVLFVLMVFTLSGPVAAYIASMDKYAIGNAIGSIGVFVGFLVYRRVWAFLRR